MSIESKQYKKDAIIKKPEKLVPQKIKEVIAAHPLYEKLKPEAQAVVFVTVAEVLGTSDLAPMAEKIDSERTNNRFNRLENVLFGPVSSYVEEAKETGDDLLLRKIIAFRKVRLGLSEGKDAVFSTEGSTYDHRMNCEADLEYGVGSSVATDAVITLLTKSSEKPLA